MKNDPLNPGPVTPMEEDEEERTAQDTRPWWMRLFTSLRPSIASEKIVRTGKNADEFEIKGHVEFLLLVTCHLSLVTLFSGCTVDNPAAGNQIAYRVNNTGAIGGADESSCVVHYYTDPPGIFHDCEGAHKRTWQQLVIYVNGRPSRIFQEISGPQAMRDRAAIYHFELHWLGLTPSGFWPAWPIELPTPGSELPASV